MTETISVCRDPRDDKFLALAVAGQADYLVTGDADLLDLGSFRGIPVICISDALALALQERQAPIRPASGALDKGVRLNMVQKWLGPVCRQAGMLRSARPNGLVRADTTAIYGNAIGAEVTALAARLWENNEV